MINAGGGSQIDGGLDATVVSQSQVVLSTRIQTNEFNYPQTFQSLFEN